MGKWIRIFIKIYVLTLLYKIFKDADGLDRIRLGGIREIDVNQLRLDVSKELTLVARIMY